MFTIHLFPFSDNLKTLLHGCIKTDSFANNWSLHYSYPFKEVHIINVAVVLVQSTVPYVAVISRINGILSLIQIGLGLSRQHCGRCIRMKQWHTYFTLMLYLNWTSAHFRWPRLNHMTVGCESDWWFRGSKKSHDVEQKNIRSKGYIYHCVSERLSGPVKTFFLHFMTLIKMY